MTVESQMKQLTLQSTNQGDIRPNVQPSITFCNEVDYVSWLKHVKCEPLEQTLTWRFCIIVLLAYKGLI